MLFNMRDYVRYCDPHKGLATPESMGLDGGNGGMKDDFRGIMRGVFMTEAPISVDSRRKVWNGIRWQVSTEVESMIPTSISINPRDCKRPPVDRESEFIPRMAANVPWVEYHVGMRNLNIHTVGNSPSMAAWNAYNYHDGYDTDATAGPGSVSVECVEVKCEV